MGVVWKAFDTTLDREVAIKIVTERFATDPDRLARFDREAKVLASLNHPNIAVIYGLHEAQGTHFLAMEMIEGENLAQRLSRGFLSLEEALGLARQIADALEAAHDAGVIHRDLKPANIQLTSQGKAKVLDFGLAKALEVETSVDDPSASPTVTSGGTASGVILGTATYMSPEQARGQAVNRRTDIWSFGCVLYEMLTGQRAFEGTTTSDVIARILEREPDWQALPSGTPHAIRGLLRRCLQKDPHNRLHDSGDARIEIEETLSAPADDLAEVPEVARWRFDPRAVVASVVVGLVVGAALMSWVLRDLSGSASPRPAPAARFEVQIAPEARLALGKRRQVARPLAISPDGSRLVYAAERGDTISLVLRRLDRFEEEILPNTEGGNDPFFSHDGGWVGFFSEDGWLRKVPMDGGPAVDVADVRAIPGHLVGLGAVWTPDDTIVFSLGGTSGLWRVPAGGGSPEPLTKLNGEAGEALHTWPSLLPDGTTVLFTVLTGENRPNEAWIETVNLESGERSILVRGGTDGRYTPTGHLVYVRSGEIVAAPFDIDELGLTGPAQRVLGMDVRSVRGAAQFVVSQTGPLAFISGQAADESNLVWVDREGNAVPLDEEPRWYNPNVCLSPDGRRVVTEIYGDVWVLDLERATETRLTFDGARMATWGPEGDKVIYAAGRSGTQNIYWRAADGTGQPEQLTEGDYVQAAPTFSLDRQALAFYEVNPQTNRDIWHMTQVGRGDAEPFLATPFDEFSPRFSPDGRWLAYTSSESGRPEVYVRPYPSGDGRWQISNAGGWEAVWARDGKEIFYRNGDSVMVVAIRSDGGFSAGKPRLLFKGEYLRGGWYPAYDVHPDGYRFIMIRPTSRSADSELRVVMDGLAMFRRAASETP